MLTGWTHPTTKNEAGEEIMKREEKWSTEEDKLANNNSRALNAISNGINVNPFKLSQHVNWPRRLEIFYKQLM